MLSVAIVLWVTGATLSGIYRKNSGNGLNRLHNNLLHYYFNYCLFVFYYPDIYDCAKFPCKNGGTCKNTPWSYQCTCKLGYTGKNCEKGKLVLSVRSNLLATWTRLFFERHWSRKIPNYYHYNSRCYLLVIIILMDALDLHAKTVLLVEIFPEVTNVFVKQDLKEETAEKWTSWKP